LFVDLGCFLRRPTRYITQFRFDFASEISFAEIHEGLDVKTEPFAAEMGEDVEEDGGGVEGIEAVTKKTQKFTGVSFSNFNIYRIFF
jgi:hypothetical protein